MAIGDKTIQVVEDKLKDAYADELRQQGHYLTGALEQSIGAEKEETGDGIAIEITANDYADPVNDGVPAHKIPYDSSQTTGAKHSKYIEGLKNYAKLRFGLNNEEDALSAAFAIAKKHEKEGMPTQGSYAYSTNGKRTEAIERAYNTNEKHIDRAIDDGIDAELDDLLDMNFDLKII